MRKIVLSIVCGVFMLTTAVGASAQNATPATGTAFAGMGYQELHIVATDSEFQAPAEANAGLTVLTFENQSSDEASVTLAGPQQGETMDDLLATAQAGSEDEGLPQWLYGIPLLGGTIAQPGETEEVLVNLIEGDWATVGEGNQAPAFIHVSPAEGAASTEPDADLSAELKEFEIIGIPDQLTVGEHLIKIANSGQQPHVLMITRGPDGVTADEVLALFNAEEGGTPPAATPTVSEDDFTQIAGTELLSSGGTIWLPVDLQPGTYVLTCYVADPETGMPHEMLGMLQIVTVS
jgi:hypothetical protein